MLNRQIDQRLPDAIGHHPVDLQLVRYQERVEVSDCVGHTRNQGVLKIGCQRLCVLEVESRILLLRLVTGQDRLDVGARAAVARDHQAVDGDAARRYLLLQDPAAPIVAEHGKDRDLPDTQSAQVLRHVAARTGCVAFGHDRTWETRGLSREK